MRNRRAFAAIIFLATVVIIAFSFESRLMAGTKKKTDIKPASPAISIPIPMMPSTPSNAAKEQRLQVAGPFVIKENGLYRMYFKEQLKDGKPHISTATSKDGIVWEKYNGNPIITPGKDNAWDSNRAGPGSYLKKDGIYMLWYTGFNKEGITAIGHATSKDGIKWQKHKASPVLKASSSGWDSTSVIAPRVIYDNEEKIFKMWYRGKRHLKEKGGNEHAIGYATSKDGVKWEKYNGNPVLSPGNGNEWDAGNFVGDPTVIKINGEYRMWYCNMTNKDGLEMKETGYATSKDGIKWEKHKASPVLKRSKTGWDSFEAANIFVMFDEGIYKLWYKGSGDKIDSIGYATSKDGVKWEKYNGNPVLSP